MESSDNRKTTVSVLGLIIVKGVIRSQICCKNWSFELVFGGPQILCKEVMSRNRF